MPRVRLVQTVAVLVLSLPVVAGWLLQTRALAQSQIETPTTEEGEQHRPSLASLRTLRRRGAFSELGVQVAQALSDVPAGDRAPLLWLAAQAKAEADDVAQAIVAYREIAETRAEVLGPWARLRWGQLELKRDPATALEALKPLRRFSGTRDADHTRGVAHKLLGQRREATTFLRRSIKGTSVRARVHTRLELAEVLARGGSRSRREAVEIARGVLNTASSKGIHKRALRILRRVLGKRGARRAQRRTAKENLNYGHALYDRRRHDEAARTFAKAAKMKGLSRADRCEALLYQGRAYLRSRRRKEAARHFRRVHRRCKLAVERIVANYLGGEAHAQVR